MRAIDGHARGRRAPSPARQARIRLASEGVVASYIHDISTRGRPAPARARERRVAREQRRVLERFAVEGPQAIAGASGSLASAASMSASENSGSSSVPARNAS